jgi:glycine cleavage system regulatory protein
MEATFVLNAQEDRKQFADRLTEFFAGKTIRVRVEEVRDEAVGQQQLLKRMEALRLLTEQVPVTLPPGLDINDIIDEVNDNSLYDS